MKSAFLLSKGLLCLYDKQNYTWLLVDMEFLFSCSTRHLTHSLCSPVRNSISTRAHVLFSIYLLFYSDPLSMYFSCFVDINSSKFQISRKVGKIFFDISKRSDGTEGELVIQNLAPLPLHAMPEWDSKLTDIRYVQNGIFHKRTTKECYTSNDSVKGLGER